MTQVRVDFNATARGLVKASERRASAPLRVGQQVWAIDEDEHMAVTCRVESIEPNGRVWLRPRWAQG